jgi:plastocyanin
MVMRTAAAAILLTGLCSTAAGAAETHVVTTAGAAYAPAEITAKVGDSIRFINDDQADHDVFVPTIDHAVDLGVQKPGTEATLKLGRSGRFDVECVIHDHMKLVVEVQP